MDFRERLVRGLLSSIGARSVGIASQLVSVPVLARAWGVETYGEYLTILAIAGYIPLLTLGVHQSALSDMSIAHSRGDSDRFGNTLRGLFQIVFALSVLALGVQTILAFQAAHLGLIPARPSRTFALPAAVFFLGLQQILVLNLGVATNGIAATGRYGEAQLLDTIRVGLDSALLWIAVLALGWGPDRTSMVSATLTLAVSLAAWTRLRTLSPQAHGLFRRVAWRRFAELWKSVTGNFVLTNGYNAFIIQGPRLLLAAVAGPVAVATFAIVWTLLGVLRQGFEALLHPLTVEFAYAYGERARERAEKMLAAGSAFALGLCLVAGPLVIGLGPWFVALATKGRLHPSLTLMTTMWVVLTVYASTLIFHIALVASNRAHAALWRFLVCALVGAGLAYGLARVSGLNGVAAGLLLFQAGFSAIVAVTAVRVFQLEPLRMARSLLDLHPRALLKGLESARVVQRME